MTRDVVRAVKSATMLMPAEVWARAVVVAAAALLVVDVATREEARLTADDTDDDIAPVVALPAAVVDDMAGAWGGCLVPSRNSNQNRI